MAGMCSAAAFYRSPSPMTVLPDSPALADVPTVLDDLRSVVQGLLLHREWAADYGVDAGAVRVEETEPPVGRGGAGASLRDLSGTGDHRPGAGRPCGRHLLALRGALRRAAEVSGLGGAGALRFRRLLRCGQVVRPLDHRALGRRALGQGRSPD